MISLRPCDKDGFVTSLINIDFSWLNKQLQKWDFSPLGRQAKQLLMTHCRSRFPLFSPIKKPSGEPAVPQPFLSVRPEWSSSSAGGAADTCPVGSRPKVPVSGRGRGNSKETQGSLGRWGQVGPPVIDSCPSAVLHSHLVVAGISPHDVPERGAIAALLGSFSYVHLPVFHDGSADIVCCILPPIAGWCKRKRL